jgi:hypothetical protein
MSLPLGGWLTSHSYCPLAYALEVPVPNVEMSLVLVFIERVRISVSSGLQAIFPVFWQWLYIQRPNPPWLLPG